MSDVVPELNRSIGFSVIREIAVGHGAVTGIAVSPDGGTLTLTHYGDDSVSLIDTTQRSPALTVTDIAEPFAVAMSGKRAYVSGVRRAYDEILALDTYSEYIVASYPVGFDVTDFAVSPDGRFVYAARTGDDGAHITVLDIAANTKKSISIAATTAGCVRVNPDGRRLYVAANSATTAELLTIDTRRNRVISTVEIGSPIRDVALSPDGATAYVASFGPDFGTVLDVVDVRKSTINATYKIGATGSTLAQLIVSRSGERAYLVGDQHVTVLSIATQEVVGNIEVGDQPSCVVESPDGRRLYVADYAGTVTMLEVARSANAELTAPGVRTHSDLLMLQPSLA